MKRIVKILLLVIIPLLIAAGIGTYSYIRYKDSYFNYYMASSSFKDSAKEINAYVKYKTDNYYLYDDEVVKDEDGNELFTMNVYRWFTVDDDDNKTFEYFYVLYNVNYGNIHYESEDADTDFAEMPSLNMELIQYSDIEDPEDAELEDYDDISSKYTASFSQHETICDYNYVGYVEEDGTETQEYSSGDEINQGNKIGVRYVDANVSNTDFNSKVRLIITATNKAGTADTTTIIYQNDFSNYYTSVGSWDTEENTYGIQQLEIGYGEDIQEAGYNGYVFGKFIWWEALIAIVLTEVVTISAVVVWDSESKKEAERKAKINSKHKVK
ncbi:MAG: hypothetical protein WCS56_00525 [Bacilli bacterium]